ncbi:MAG: beta-ketoacyl-ACP synthase III [Ardenticatenaceae bacterium]|nr:beta-ketoacyl-ACP synthase III [Ardenticatenaceae bacterium]
MKYAHIIGWGHYLPKQILTNDEIASEVDTNHEWIFTRTGISSRRIADKSETAATLAFEAAARALTRANIHPSEVDLIIVATSTPEYIFPSTASQVQSYLGAENAGAFDLSAACSGFVYALDMATQAIGTGSVRNAIVIGAEVMSRVLDWKDRGTCILFGDGAGAVVLQGSSIPGGVLASTMHADGSGGNLLSLPAVYHNPIPALGEEFLSQNGTTKNTIDMQGRQVFRFASRVVPESIMEVAEKANWNLDEIDLVVPHQANVRIIESVSKKIGIPMSKFFMNVNHAGNTSAASIPIALCEAVDAGRLRPNDNVVFVGFGGGLTWSAAAVNWLVLPSEKQPRFLDHEWRRMRYVFARQRAKLRQWSRQIGARLAGSPTPDASLKDGKNKK